MITRGQIHELAQFEDQDACALSFYFQPAAPRNKAHKEETILTKDLAREVLRQLEGSNKKSKRDSARADLDRIMRLSQDLRANGSHAKGVFACAAHGFWQEYDLPASLSATQLFAGRHFRLKPLAHMLGVFPSLGVVLVDRHRARLFDLRLGELREREGFFHPHSRRGRGDGFAGYDGGHAERRVADETRQHFKFVADFLKDALDKGMFENWILGCQETHWPQFEAQLHSYVSQRLVGRFAAEIAHISKEQIRTQAEQVFSDWQKKRCTNALEEALSQARNGGRGTTGLRRVLNALESGEVQTLLMAQNYRAHAVECSACGHLDAHLVTACPACGWETRQVVDVAEAILPRAIQRNVELFSVPDNPELDKVGNIAALLRFRSEQGKILPVSAESSKPVQRGDGLVGRYRGFASG